jgi:hypothetical protein
MNRRFIFRNRPDRQARRRLCTWAVLVLMAGMPPAIAAAADPIYRCIDENGRVLYTSERCKGGVELEIDAGKADPAAIDRLRRNVDAERMKDAARSREQAELALMSANMADAPWRGAPYAGGGEPDYGGPNCEYCGAWTFFPYLPQQVMRPHRARPMRPQHVVPATGVKPHLHG